jgi:RNA polymerase primary sigma factor
VDELADATGLTHAEVRQAQELSRDILSLDASIGFEDERTLADILESDNVDMNERMYDDARGDALREAVARLRCPRHRLVLTRRFDLDGQGAWTLEEVGRLLGVTRERTRQIEQQAFKLLERTPGLRSTCGLDETEEQPDVVERADKVVERDDIEHAAA